MLKNIFGKKNKTNGTENRNSKGSNSNNQTTPTPTPTLTPTQLKGMTLNKGNLAQALDPLEEFLITSDMGLDATTQAVEQLRADIITGNINNMMHFVEELNTNLLDMLKLPTGTGTTNNNTTNTNTTTNTTNTTNTQASDNGEFSLLRRGVHPSVVMLVGVNGVGKTTSLAKLAHYYKNILGKKVLIAAADTYRAAAVDQLQHWGDTVGVEVISQQQGADSAAVMYDALSRGIATESDLLLCDTSGRLQGNDNLMRELEKSTRVLKKLSAGAPHEVLLVIDATLGSNSILQAKVFSDYIAPTGIVLTKADAHLQPGSLFQIVQGLGLPIRFVSYGEGVDQLSAFQPYAFVGDFISGYLRTFRGSGA